ncbi:40S ribosomal protein [Datura stramonium]|uniref:Small ribosomal subunit protein uS5 n=1 Tax=Datura stramonium TaxID=4076 RepID=A0ABS8UQA3_DATST|nr:40S ribosomal protein [Datura stramonium]
MSVQKQTRAGQRTWFKAFIVVGVGNGQERLFGVEMGDQKRKKKITKDKNKIGKPHTVPCKVTGKCGYVTVRMVLAPRVVGIVAARVPKKVLQFAGMENVFTSSHGFTKTLDNFIKL